MKKILAILLIMAMSASLLIGCGGSDKDTSGDVNVENNDAENNDAEKEEVVIDTSIYSEKIELVTEEGQKVQIYYDPTVVSYIAGKDEMGEYCFLGEMTNPSVVDVESAQAYVDSIISYNEGYLEIGEQKESSLGDYMVHYFSLKDTESGGFAGEIWAIELGSDVVLTFTYMGSVEEGGQLDTELNAIKFVVGDGITVESSQNDNNEVEAVIENDKFDENKYYSEYLKTSDGKNVTVYMDMDAEITWEVDTDVPSSIYIYDKNRDVCYFSVNDAATAEEYANNILEWNDYLEIGTQEEIQLAGRTIHTYHFVDKETGEVFISEGVIELASDVVFTFTYNHMKYSESGLEEVLEALRFVVEE